MGLMSPSARYCGAICGGVVRQRTQLANAMRGHAAEMGVVAPLGEKG